MSEETKSPEPGQDTPAARLKIVLPVLFGLLDEARELEPTSKIEGALLAVRADRTGQLLGRFEITAFLADIAALVGYERDPKEERLEAGVQKILDQVSGR